MGIILLVTIFIGAMTVLLMNNMHKKEIKELELIIENFENCFAQKSEKLSTLHDDYRKLESRYTKKVREVESVWDKVRLQEHVAIDFSKEITKLKEENLKLSEQLPGQQKAYKLLTDRLSRTIHHCEALQTSLDSAEHQREAIDRHRNALQNYLTKVKDNFDSLQKVYYNLYGENLSLKEDVEHLEDEIEIKSVRIQELGEIVQNFEEEVFKRDNYAGRLLDAVNHSNTFEECVEKVKRLKLC